MELQNTSSSSEERRNFVRAQDAVGLHIQPLTETQTADPLAAPSVQKKVRRQDKYEIDGYADVRRDHPAVASYIDELEERIRQLLLNGEESPVIPTHKVSISASGIHFADRVLLQPGDMVGLTITLFPSGKRIGADAQILSGNNADGIAKHGEPSYRAAFIRISPENRQVIDVHVRQLREKRTYLQD